MLINFYMRTAKTYINYKLHRYNPFAIFFLITTRCDSKCPKCIVRKYKFRRELTTKEIFSLIGEASDLGVSYFSITGGEPLLRKDIEQIGHKIRKNGMIASLSTNGHFITKERAKKLIKYFDYIRISLDGFEEIHDKLRGKVSFKKTYNGIKTIVAERNKLRSKTKIGIISIVSELNYKKIKEFFNNFKNEVDFIDFQPAHGIDSIFSNPKFTRSWKNICKNRDKSGDLEEFVDKPSLEKGKKYCDAAKLYIMIDPQGNVFSCLPERNNFIGNLKEKNLSSLWHSKEILIARQRTKDCIGCYTKCTTEISKIFRMNLFEILLKLPKFIKIYKL